MYAPPQLPGGIARGHWQREILRELLTDEGMRNPLYYLRGNARSYEGRYRESLEHMLRRAMDQGFVVTKELGPRGGSWSATYKMHRGSFGALVIRDHDGKLLRVVHPDIMPRGCYVVGVSYGITGDPKNLSR